MKDNDYRVDALGVLVGQALKSGADYRLPSDFVRRLQSEAGAGRSHAFRMPRSMKIAASILAMVSFASIASWVAVEALHDNGPEEEEASASKEVAFKWPDVKWPAAETSAALEETPIIAATPVEPPPDSIPEDSGTSALDEISSNRQDGEATMNMQTIKTTARQAVLAAAVATTATLTAQAGLVARWDFNNYDSENPTSAAILAPTVGSLAAIPCTGTGSSTEVTDGTLGSITVVNTGLPEGDYALSIPQGAHLKIPLPSGIVRDKSWMLRVRFYDPTASQGSLRTLVGHNLSNPAAGLWYLSNLNLIQGNESLFGTATEENKNTTGNIGAQGSNGMTAFRQVSANTWHSFTAHFGPNGASSTLDGYRSVSLADTTDIRSNFTGDGFLLCAGGYEKPMYISSVEVWEDMPLYHKTGYLPMTSATLFTGCSLNDIRDLYFTVKGLGRNLGYARVMSSWEHIVTDDGAGNTTGLKIDIRTKQETNAVLAGFTESGTDVAGASLGLKWGSTWPTPYFNPADGSYVTSSNYGNTGTQYNSSGTTSPYNLYALPFRPFDGSLNWSMQMGTGKFGNPVLSVVGNNPTLTFDAAPQADSLTLDCGRGDGAASVTFAYGSAALKTMSGLGDLNIGCGVNLAVPSGVSIAGELTFEDGAKLTINIAGESHEIDDVLFTATEGINLPAGKTISDVVSSEGRVKLSADGKQILYTQTEWTLDANKTWSTLRNGATLASDEVVRITVTGGSKNHMLTIDEDVDIGRIMFVDGSAAIFKVAAGCTLEADSITGLGFPWVDSGAMLYVDGTVDATSLLNNGTVVKRVADDVSIPVHNGSAGTTIVSNGTLKVLRRYDSGTANVIRVVSGARFDMNGVQDVTANIVLEDGATFANTGAAIDHNKAQAVSLTLDGNATAAFSNDFGLIGPGHGATTLALGSNTLTLNGSNMNFWLDNTTITGDGTIYVEHGWLHPKNKGSVGNNCTLNIPSGGALNLEANLTVSNFVNSTKSGNIKGSSILTVTGQLTPGSAAIPKLTLADGATVKATGTKQTVSTTFSASGTVTIDASAITAQQLKAAENNRIPVMTVPTEDKGGNWTVANALFPSARAKWVDNGNDTSTLYLCKYHGTIFIIR